MTNPDNLHIFSDPAALANAAAARWEEISREAIDKRGQCAVALAGGSTPETLYRLLASPERRNRIDWRATQVFFGDERCVPPDHPDSNYRMADDALLTHVDLPAEQVHRIEGEREPAHAARSYQELLRRRLEPEAGDVPRFDLVLLGLGPDGHIASLFPDTPILDETRKWVDACYVDKLRAWRVSLTFPVLNAARHVLLLVAGGNKAEIITEALGPGHRDGRYPVQRLAPAGGPEWLLDRAAAVGLDQRIE